MLKIVEDSAVPNSAGGSLLDEIVRDGARQMLAAALLAEVAATSRRIAARWMATGHRLVVRNGFHQPREVTTAAGAVPVRQPRVNDKRIDEVTGERRRFSSAILPAWSRKSPRVAEVLPLLYLHGLSSSDFGPALEQFLGSDQGLSAATITRLTDAVARRGAGVQHPVAGRLGLRLLLGRRHPPEGPVGGRTRCACW